MRRTIITVTALLLASTNLAQGVQNDYVANADVSDMVIEDDMFQLRQLVNATAAKAKKEAKKEENGGDDDGDGESTEGAPDESSMAGDEEEMLQDKQGAPEISEE